MEHSRHKTINVAMALALVVMLVPVLLNDPAQAAGNVSVTKTLQPPSADNYLDAKFDNSNYGGASELSLCSNDSKVIRPILKFATDSIPNGSNVTSANLSLYYYDNFKDPVGRTYWAYRITETDWVEGTETGWTEAGSSDWNHRQHDSLSWTTAGGTYTTTDGASTTVPSSYGWMHWSVTSQVQYAIDNNVDAHFLIKDSDETADYRAYFYSKEATQTNLRPKLTIIYTAPWDSYESNYSTLDDLYDTAGDIIYMKGTGFAAGSYIVRYYDAEGIQVGTDANITIGTGEDLQSQMACNADEDATAGTWNAKVYLSDGTTLIADDTFTVTSTAIPEFATVITAIVVIGLCSGLYYRLRRRLSGAQS